MTADVASLSHFERFQIHRAVSSKRNSTTSDLVTAAIVVSSTGGIFGGIARMKARSLWGAAKEKVHSKVAEQLVLHSLDVGNACTRLALATKVDEFSDTDRECTYTPLETLACGVVKERVRGHLGKLFVEAVAGEEEGVVMDEKEEEQERRKTIDAARELGGSVESLGRLFERVWKTDSVELEDVTEQFTCVDSGNGCEDLDGEIKSLFTALVLYRRVFDDDASSETECDSCKSSTPTMVPSTLLLSPPPSPRTAAPLQQRVSSAMQMTTKRREQNRMLLDLRTALGSRVFEDGPCAGVGEAKGDFGIGLEDARDRVVDLVVDLERKERADFCS
jgi:hypothetical protein